MTKKILIAIAVLCLGMLALAAQSVDDDGTILKFNSMAGVTGPYVGPTNPIRDVPGGGLPWIIAESHGHLKANGELKLRVSGLVIPSPPFNFTNPLPDFRVIVSCQSIDGANNPSIVNLITAPFPADTEGNAYVDTTVSLPQPCIAPILFVTHPTSDPPRWFAATGL